MLSLLDKALGYFAFNFNILLIIIVDGALSYLCWVEHTLRLHVRITLLAYYVYHFGISRAHVKQGQPWRNLSRNYPLFVWARRFLQLQTVVVDEDALGKEKQCIFAAFPHGVNSDFRILLDGMWADLFPDLDIRTLAASILFQIPLVREFALWTGCVDASRPVAERQLRNNKSLLILPGGQAEQIRTLRGQERVYLSRRKGFIKLAMKHQIPVVPVYVFGSSDGYHTSHFLLRFRQWLVQTVGVSWTLAVGFGLSPFSPLPDAPNTIVVGKPMRWDVKDRSEVSSKELNAAHDDFCRALVGLFDSHKAEYGYGDRQLEVI